MSILIADYVRLCYGTRSYWGERMQYWTTGPWTPNIISGMTVTGSCTTRTSRWLSPGTSFQTLEIFQGNPIETSHLRTHISCQDYVPRPAQLLFPRLLHDQPGDVSWVWSGDFVSVLCIVISSLVYFVINLLNCRLEYYTYIVTYFQIYVIFQQLECFDIYDH